MIYADSNLHSQIVLLEKLIGTANNGLPCHSRNPLEENLMMSIAFGLAIIAFFLK